IKDYSTLADALFNTRQLPAILHSRLQGLASLRSRWSPDQRCSLRLFYISRCPSASFYEDGVTDLK
ncbi:MAG: hypothetical protein ABIN57_05395, partial [Chitinophagaceae bacterium]